MEILVSLFWFILCTWMPREYKLFRIIDWYLLTLQAPYLHHMFGDELLELWSHADFSKMHVCNTHDIQDILLSNSVDIYADHIHIKNQESCLGHDFLPLHHLLTIDEAEIIGRSIEVVGTTSFLLQN